MQDRKPLPDIRDLENMRPSVGARLVQVLGALFTLACYAAVVGSALIAGIEPIQGGASVIARVAFVVLLIVVVALVSIASVRGAGWESLVPVSLICAVVAWLATMMFLVALRGF